MGGRQSNLGLNGSSTSLTAPSSPSIGAPGFANSAHLSQSNVHLAPNSNSRYSQGPSVSRSSLMPPANCSNSNSSPNNLNTKPSSIKQSPPFLCDSDADAELQLRMELDLGSDSNNSHIQRPENLASPPSKVQTRTTQGSRLPARFSSVPISTGPSSGIPVFLTQFDVHVDSTIDSSSQLEEKNLNAKPGSVSNQNRHSMAVQSQSITTLTPSTKVSQRSGKSITSATSSKTFHSTFSYTNEHENIQSISNMNMSAQPEQIEQGTDPLSLPSALHSSSESEPDAPRIKSFTRGQGSHNEMISPSSKPNSGANGEPGNESASQLKAEDEDEVEDTATPTASPVHSLPPSLLLASHSSISYTGLSEGAFNSFSGASPSRQLSDNSALAPNSSNNSNVSSSFSSLSGPGAVHTTDQSNVGAHMSSPSIQPSITRPTAAVNLFEWPSMMNAREFDTRPNPNLLFNSDFLDQDYLAVGENPLDLSSRTDMHTQKPAVSNSRPLHERRAKSSRSNSAFVSSTSSIPFPLGSSALGPPNANSGPGDAALLQRFAELDADLSRPLGIPLFESNDLGELDSSMASGFSQPTLSSNGAGASRRSPVTSPSRNDDAPAFGSRRPRPYSTFIPSSQPNASISNPKPNLTPTPTSTPNASSSSSGRLSFGFGSWLTGASRRLQSTNANSNQAQNSKGGNPSKANASLGTQLSVDSGHNGGRLHSTSQSSALPSSSRAPNQALTGRNSLALGGRSHSPSEPMFDREQGFFSRLASGGAVSSPTPPGQNAPGSVTGSGAEVIPATGRSSTSTSASSAALVNPGADPRAASLIAMLEQRRRARQQLEREQERAERVGGFLAALGFRSDAPPVPASGPSSATATANSRYAARLARTERRRERLRERDRERERQLRERDRSDSESSEEGDEGDREANTEGEHAISAHSLASLLPILNLLPISGLKCPYCKKVQPPDDFEFHLVVCMTRPRATFNEDMLDAAAAQSLQGNECAICLEEFEAGNHIARLPCLCIYHLKCIKNWFSVKESCPQHPIDD